MMTDTTAQKMKPQSTMKFRVWDAGSKRFISDPMTQRAANKLRRNLGGVGQFQVVAVAS